MDSRIPGTWVPCTVPGYWVVAVGTGYCRAEDHRHWYLDTFRIIVIRESRPFFNSTQYPQRLQYTAALLDIEKQTLASQQTLTGRGRCVVEGEAYSCEPADPDGSRGEV
eukprot:2481511-Rhodomonas_salina.1